MVYVDSKGFRVETVPDSPDGVVTFYPQGGGFQRMLPVIVFHSIYKQERAAPGFRRAVFVGDWNEKPVPGFTDGNRWNGWAIPYFEFETAQEIMAETGEDPSVFRYDPEEDAFIYNNPDWPEEPEVYGATFIDIDGKPVKVYGIGAGFWCWYERGNDE